MAFYRHMIRARMAMHHPWQLTRRYGRSKGSMLPFFTSKESTIQRRYRCSLSWMFLRADHHSLGGLVARCTMGGEECDVVIMQDKNQASVPVSGVDKDDYGR
ncbi:hypothetical protein VFPPC_18389 [Pochonia chlamydosporia 170]|uniref:Uncharacterized protein n=1 Tax=Pochonia chlamydosporia 170 TaxID=1380566 RepID=A0A219ANU3_METCM|nr:hypothetical protein VFPPC_18389 [Pochonia chlamydosporia 170]OWT42496.1 hypothetical protein VFPPC_18389 [Pochonia chlamydosporia 170]